MKHDTAKKVIASALCAGMVLGSVGMAAHAVNVKDSDQKITTSASSVMTQGNVEGLFKDETVYVFTEADGTAKKVLVNDWIQNGDKADQFADETNLKDIVNVKGDETFTDNGNGSLTWDANGEDIYYQGTSEEDLPVEMFVCYTLDGKEISPEDLAGKSGKVVIRYDYTNHRSEQVKINGENETIYAPFTVITGMLLDTDIFRNVTVTNGVLENMGNQIAVVGLAFPGMQDNLDISKDDYDIPDYVEITADVENFELSTSMSLVSTALFNELDMDELNLDDLSESADKLRDGMNQLMEGSDALHEGLNTLLEQSKILVEGINALANGADQLKDGADALQSGAGQLYDGATQLSQGLSTLNQNSAALNNGAQAVFQTLLNKANEELAKAGLAVPTLTIDNYATVLNGVIESLDETNVYAQAQAEVTKQVEARRPEIEAGVTAVVRENVTAAVKAAVTDQVRATVQAKAEPQVRAAVIAQALNGMTVEEYQAAVEAGAITEEQQAGIEQAIADALAAAVQNQMDSEGVKSQIDQLTKENTDAKMATEEIKALIAQNVEDTAAKKIAEAMASDEVQAKLQAAAAGAQAVIGLKASLDSYNSFYLGLKTYTAGVGTAANGANSLVSGLETLKNGSVELNGGVSQLNDGLKTMQGKAPELIEGITQLRDGSAQLSEGLNTLMEEGIQKILDLAENDLAGLLDRVDAMVGVSQKLTSFSGLADKMDGSVKFIYKMESISANS